MATPQISVLTVNYESAADVRTLAASLMEHGDGLCVELIVANNSPAESLELPSGDRLAIRVLDIGANVGYASGVNRALQHAGAPIVMVANPDVRVVGGTLTGAIGILQRTPDAGLLLPLLRYPDGSIQSSIRRFYTWPVILFARSPLRALTHEPPFFRRYLYSDLDRSRPADVDWGLGAAMFLRREEWGDGPLFDERFFMYFEDVDLCLRIWGGGRRVVYRPEVECRHEHRRASGNPLSKAGWHHFRSLVRFVRKHGGLPQRAAVAQATPARSDTDRSR